MNCSYIRLFFLVHVVKFNIKIPIKKWRNKWLKHTVRCIESLTYKHCVSLCEYSTINTMSNYLHCSDQLYQVIKIIESWKESIGRKIKRDWESKSDTNSLATHLEWPATACPRELKHCCFQTDLEDSPFNRISFIHSSLPRLDLGHPLINHS